MPHPIVENHYIPIIETFNLDQCHISHLIKNIFSFLNLVEHFGAKIKKYGKAKFTWEQAFELEPAFSFHLQPPINNL